VVNHLLLWAADNSRLERTIAGNPLADKTVHRFVAGAKLSDAVEAAVDLNAHGIDGILDLLGEGVQDLTGADEATAEYLDAVQAIADRKIDSTVSLKLSQLGLTVDRAACSGNLERILDRANELRVGVEVDMEQSGFVDDSLEVYRNAVSRYPDTRLAIQVCLRRTVLDLESLAPFKPRIRLVKGAYAEPVALAHRGKDEIRAQYHYLTDWLIANGSLPAFGTHDDACIQYAEQAAQRAGLRKQDFEIQMLYGIRRDLQQKLADDGYRVRVYIPFGSAWYPYLMRRMAERPANLRFFARSLIGR
jgi:proline dehydrogenase